MAVQKLRRDRAIFMASFSRDDFKKRAASV